MKRPLLVAVLVTVVGSAPILWPSVASAEPTAEEHDRARALLSAGRMKRSAGDHAGALDSFRAAHAIEKLSTTGYEVGRTLVDLGRLVEARDVLSDVAKAPAAAGEPPPLAAARADARALVDRIDARIPTLVIKLAHASDPSSLTATIDGVTVALDLLDRPRRLDPGAHVVVVKGRTSEKTVRVELAEGASREVTIEAPSDATDAVASAHPAAHPLPLRAEERSHLVAWVAGGAAIAAAVTGVIGGVMATEKKQELEPHCPSQLCPPAYHDDLRTADAFALTSTIAFTVAGVATAVVIWDLVRTPSGKAASKRPAFSGAFVF